MTPPSARVKNCPEWIREHALPHDECAPALEKFIPRGERYYRLSANLDILKQISGEEDRSTYLGVGLMFRPLNFGSHILGIGAQTDLNFDEEWNAMGRLQYGYALPPHGMYRPSLTGLIGTKKVSNQARRAVDFEEKQQVTGTLLNTGLELSLDIRLDITGGNIPILTTLSPFFAVNFIPGQTLPTAEDPSRSIRLSGTREAILGLRIGWGVFNNGGYRY